jgi:hypothetical protein
MTSCPAEIEAPDRSLVSRIPGQRAHVKELVEGHLAVVSVAFGQAKAGFEITRQKDLLVKNRIS